MRAAIVGLAVIAGLGCAKGQPAAAVKDSSVLVETSPTLSGDAGTRGIDDDAPAADAGLDASSPDVAERVRADDWVLFENHGDPEDGVWPESGWSLETPRLPAVSEDGTLVLVASSVQGLGYVPNVSVSVMRAAGEAPVRTFSILDEKEVVRLRFVDAGKHEEFEALAGKVRRRIAALPSELPAKVWAPIARCPIVDDPSQMQPPCSKAQQRAECDGMQLTYSGAQLRLVAGSRTAVVAAPRGRVHSVPNADVPDHPWPVRACFGGLWLDPTHRLLVGELLQECQGGGDSCSAPAEWHVLVLPFVAH
jgi:hypothetical protein